MAKIRFGVIGVGGMGTAHTRMLLDLDMARLTAVCDIIESRAAGAADETGAKPFLDHRDLIDSGLVDAVIVATPHYGHPPISIDAMKAGIHVISEKPLGVTLTAVDKVIRVAKKTGVTFSMMFQNRTNNCYQKARQMIRSGRLGELLRAHWVVADYRCQAYYDSDAWRGTWAEEGGGVLVNQAPHYTDMLWWLVGSPKTVTGRIRTKFHNIEAEDEAEAMLEYPNGATGYYYTCTSEYPARSFRRIVGDKGVLDIEGSRLRFGKLNTSLTKFDQVNKRMWGAPDVVWQDVPYKEAKLSGHSGIVENFIRAINRGTKLIAPGVEGIHQVEITCAIILSSMTGKPVTLPVDRKAYDRLMAKLARTSKVKKDIRPAARKEEVTHFSK